MQRCETSRGFSLYICTFADQKEYALFTVHLRRNVKERLHRATLSFYLRFMCQQSLHDLLALKCVI